MTTVPMTALRSRPQAEQQDKTACEITMTVSPEMLGVIEQLGQDSGQPLELVFEQAIALYRAALDAHLDGKHVGLTSTSEVLDIEFTGFPGK